MKKFSFLFCLFLFFPVLGEAKRGKSGVIKAEGGAPVEGFGFSIDASYDQSLDNLVPGYRIVNVAIVNSSFQILVLNPEQDRWYVRTGQKKKIPAIVDLRRIDPEAWAKVPQRARQLMSYPLAIPIGAQLVVDLFLPKEVKVEHLTEVIMELASMNGASFEIKAHEE